MYFSPLNSVNGILVNVIEIYILLIIVEAVISNLIAFGNGISARHPIVLFIRKLVNPVLNPVRKLLPPRSTGGWDLSPMIVIILLQFIRNMLYTR